MNFLGLIQITTLAQNVINSVVQFIWIVFIILALYLCNYTKLFLDNIIVKGLKTMYNNEEVTSNIK